MYMKVISFGAWQVPGSTRASQPPNAAFLSAALQQKCGVSRFIFQERFQSFKPKLPSFKAYGPNSGRL